MQLRTNNGNRPTLLDKLTKESKPLPQAQHQSKNVSAVSTQRSRSLAPKTDAASLAIERRRQTQQNAQSVKNPLNNLFQRRGTTGTPSNQTLAKQKQVRRGSVQTQQLTKRTPTSKPLAPKPTAASPVVRKPISSAKVAAQLQQPLSVPQRRTPGIANKQTVTPVQSVQPRAMAKKAPILKPTQSRKPQLRVAQPQKLQIRQANAKPLSKPASTTTATSMTPAQERVAQLMVEVHDKAQTAETESEYTFVLASCRRALAVEPKGELADYAKQLAAWALNRRGQLHADAGDEHHALLDFEDALKLDSNQWRALHNRAVLRAQTGDFENAFDDFNRCTELNPRFAKAYSNRGALFVQAGDLLSALQDYRRAIQLDPDLAVAHKGRGRVCHMLGSLDEALYHFDAAMLLSPQDAHAVASRADLLADTGRYSDAAEEYRRAIELDGSLTHAYRSAAWLLATCPEDSVRNATEAMEYALKAIDLDRRENVISLDTLAAAQANSGDFKAALTTMDRVLTLAPEKERSTYLLRQKLYTASQPFRIEPVSQVQAASYTK